MPPNKPTPPTVEPREVDDPRNNPVVTKLFNVKSELNHHINLMNLSMAIGYDQIAFAGPAARSSPELKKALETVGNSKKEVKDRLDQLNTILRELPSGPGYDPYRDHAKKLIEGFNLAINGKKNDAVAPWITGMQRFISNKGDVPVPPNYLRSSNPEKESGNQLQTRLENAYNQAVNAMKADSPQSRDTALKQLAHLQSEAKKVTTDFLKSNDSLSKQTDNINAKLANFDTAITAQQAQKKPDDGNLKKLLTELNEMRGQDPIKTTALFTAYGRLNDLKAKQKQLDGLITKMEKIQVASNLPDSTLQEVKKYQSIVSNLLGSESQAGSAKAVTTVAQGTVDRQKILEKLNKDYAAPSSPQPSHPAPSKSGPVILIVPKGVDLAQLLLTGGAAAAGTGAILGGGTAAAGGALTAVSGLGAIPIATNTAVGLGRLLLGREGIKGTADQITKLIITQSEITMKGLTISELSNPQFVLAAIGAIKIQGIALSTIAANSGLSLVGLAATAWTTEQYRQKAARGEPIDWKGFERDLNSNLDTMQGIELAKKDPWKKAVPVELEKMLENAGSLGKDLVEEAKRQGMSPQELAEFLKKHENLTANEALAKLRDGNVAAGGDGGDAKNPPRKSTALDDDLSWPERAKKLGYDVKVKIPPFNSHGQPVFTNGKDLLTPDGTKHGSIWKKFSLDGKTRLGSYDQNLQWLRTSISTSSQLT